MTVTSSAITMMMRMIVVATIGLISGNINDSVNNKISQVRLVIYITEY